jgi:hypothetical protein
MCAMRRLINARISLAAGMAALGPVLGLLLAGCEASPELKRRVKLREDNLCATAGAVWRSEERRPGELRSDFAYMGYALKRSAGYLKNNAASGVQILERDVRRFRNNGPVYLKKTGQLLWGHPGEIEGNAIDMFY